MIIEKGIQANCSELTMRINVNKVDPKITEQLLAKLRIECDDYYNSNEEEKTEWDDQDKKKEFEWYETSVSEDKIFGTNVITIDGNAPYNSYEEVVSVIKRYIKKPIIETEE